MRSDNNIKNVSVRLISVDFIPSWETTDLDDGRVIHHSSIGQKYIETKDLPRRLREQLEKFCLGVINDNLNRKGGEINDNTQKEQGKEERQ